MTTVMETFSDVDFNGSYTADPVMDLTGKIIRMMVRKYPADATVYLDLDTYNVGITTGDDANVGKYKVRILQKHLVRLSAGAYVFSIVATDGTFRTEINRGTLIHSAGPTRW